MFSAICSGLSCFVDEDWSQQTVRWPSYIYRKYTDYSRQSLFPEVWHSKLNIYFAGKKPYTASCYGAVLLEHTSKVLILEVLCTVYWTAYFPYSVQTFIEQFVNFFNFLFWISKFITCISLRNHHYDDELSAFICCIETSEILHLILVQNIIIIVVGAQLLMQCVGYWYVRENLILCYDLWT